MPTRLRTGISVALGVLLAALLQAAETDHRPVPAIPSGMVLIPDGTNAGTDPDFGPYNLTVDTFLMDRYEVTKGLWDEVRDWNGGNGYSYDNPGSGVASNHPVHSVNWYDCVKWCNARSEKEGREPVYYTDAALTHVYKAGQTLNPFVKESANGYRLPLDQQWHYAARGGVAGHRFPWSDSDTIQHARANYFSTNAFSYDTSPTRGYPTNLPDATIGTMPVGSYAPNGYGLYDVAGNVWEWCFDWAKGHEGEDRRARGGGWHSAGGPNRCRVGYTGSGIPDRIYDRIGLRTILPAGPSPAQKQAGRDQTPETR